MTATQPVAPVGVTSGDQKPTEKKKRTFNFELTQKKIKRSELVHLSRQLAAFLRAGVSLLQALDVLRIDGETETIRKVLGEIAEDLISGFTLTDALERHPKDFPLFYRRMLRSAELTGRLDDVLDQLALYLERDLDSRQKVKSALMYPAVVAVMAAVTVAILSIGVLPRFQTFFESLHAKLPLPTRMLLSFAHFMGHWGVLLIAAIAVAILTLTVYVRRSPRGKRRWHAVLLRTPIVSSVVKASMYERFCRLLSSLMRAGVSLLAALNVTGEALGNTAYVEAVEKIGADLVQGEGLAASISASGVFPSTVTQMVRVGEETGSLADQLDVTADFYASELDYRLKKITTLIEPVVVIAVGLAVGFVAIALISAMYGIFRQVH
jgi:type IV pilus assembly protein PilC